jgi:endoglucanase
MKNTMKFIPLIIILFYNTEFFSQKSTNNKDYNEWWNDWFFKIPEENPMAKKLPLIRVVGNKLVNSKGDTILFRGLAISDPDKIENQGYWNKKHFEKIKEMGATIVRIPVHPVAWRERTPDKYLELLDHAVEWCSELGIYVIIDWHSIGNLQMELFQDPMYNTTQKETYEFWRSIAWHFRGHNTVAFYELFNEPTTFRGMLGSMSWTEWKEIVENIIKLIRAYDNEVIPLVAGFDWAYDLNPLHDDPVNAEGIAYVTHPYATKRKPPWLPKWEENFGFAADRYPVIATEFGFDINEGETLGEDHFGNIIINYLEERKISWLAWVFDPDWTPSMLKSWDTYELTGSGEFFKKTLKEKTGK